MEEKRVGKKGRRNEKEGQTGFKGKKEDKNRKKIEERKEPGRDFVKE